MSISKHELEEMLERAAKAGAINALKSVGLGDEHAGDDIKDMRSWLNAFRMAKSTALKTSVSLITKLILLSIFAGFMYLVGVKVSLK